MKIYGIGTDIVKTSRIKKLLKKKGILERLFNKEEIKKCKKIKNSSNCFAKRFAAKEAFSKALGTGLSNGINFNEIVVLNKKSGRPYINITGHTKKIRLKKFKGKKSKISLINQTKLKKTKTTWSSILLILKLKV